MKDALSTFLKLHVTNNLFLLLRWILLIIFLIWADDLIYQLQEVIILLYYNTSAEFLPIVCSFWHFLLFVNLVSLVYFLIPLFPHPYSKKIFWITWHLGKASLVKNEVRWVLSPQKVMCPWDVVCGKCLRVTAYWVTLSLGSSSELSLRPQTPDLQTGCRGQRQPA